MFSDIIKTKERRRVQKNKSIITFSPLFDASYYSKKSKISRIDKAAEHFCAIGWRNGLNPSPYFDVEFYLATYPDVRSNGYNPLVHYLTDGAKENRRPVPDFDGAAFRAAHPEHEGENPAEACIMRYGSYAWRDSVPVTTSLPVDVIEAFRPHFDEAFYRTFNKDVLDSDTDCYDHFLTRGQYEDRDPAPNFDIFDYRRRIAGNPGLFNNPIYHYVKVGIARGMRTMPENAVVLKAAERTDARLKLKLAVHAHCFYPELISEILPRFLSFPSETRFVVTVISDGDRRFIEQICKRETFPHPLDVRVVANKGRDLAPFIVGCRDLWAECDILLHIHTKKSPHITWGDAWRHYLLDQTTGSPALVNAVLDRFAEEPDLGCFYPRNFCLIRRHTLYEANKPAVDAMLDRLNHPMPAGGLGDYPAGSMAWYRTAPLRSFIEAFGSLGYFEDEKHQIDATFAHALERGLPLVITASGGRVVSYITPTRVGPTPLKGVPDREGSAAAIPARWHRDTPFIALQPPKALTPLSKSYNSKILNIHWILPSFGLGAGGHMTIFRIVELLERFGHRQTLWLQNAEQFQDQSEAKRRIQEWYRPVSERLHVRFLPEDVRELAGDVLIATDCWTAFPAAQTTNFKERFYFVQDYEPSFHPTGEKQLLAESTYEFGFANLCAGVWLKGLMQERGLWARSWDLCADHDVYYPGARRTTTNDRPMRIAFYARPYTPRRAVALGFAAFAELHRRGVRFHVEMFGEADLKFDFDFPHTQHGILTPTELAEIYRESDLGVVFSSTNYSLIPLEMMACNLPVVEIDTPSTRAIFRNGEVAFAKQAPYQIADAIEALIADPDRRASQVRQGRAFVDRTSWENSARVIESSIFERLREIGCNSISTETIVKPAVHRPRKATVFIPTYNAGADFGRVLDAVTRQNCDFTYDVLVIDSGSSDDTVERARHYADRNLRVETILNSEFQHGRTRNRGIAHSDGEYVAIITQDACPKDERWLAHLIAGFSQGPRVAGVIGRHEAYPEHDVFTRRDMTEMFDGLALLPPVIDYENGLPSYIYPGGRTWRILTQFYSDNNSAMSREAWKILPYPEIDWGEDQVWADEMLRLGFQKAYMNDAVVYHSHAFDLESHYKTSMTEGRFWGQYFGLDLHPNPKEAIAAMNARDQAYAIRAGATAKALKHRQQLNQATVRGREAGYRSTVSWSSRSYR